MSQDEAQHNIYTYIHTHKTAPLVPDFTMKDLPLDGTATLVPAFAVKDCPWAEHSDDDRFN